MTRFVLCLAVLCIPLGCVPFDVDDDDGDDGPERIAGPEAALPAIPAGPCAGEECTGRMPYGAGCEEDDRILASKSFPGGRVTLHQSPSCGTKWAKVWRKDRRFSIAWVETEDGAGERETVTERARPSFTTRMIHAPDAPVRACVAPYRCKAPCEDTQIARAYCTEYD
jgi:hypothetical protein